MLPYEEPPNPYQTTMDFEGLTLPGSIFYQLCEDHIFHTPAPQEQISVYSVFLRRTDVLDTHARPRVIHPREAAVIMWDYLKEADRENFIVMLLDTKNQIIGINTVGIGILDSVQIHPREVFKPAILANAASIIISHNHPSGDPTPSRRDKETSENIKAAGEILGIEVLDHIIIGEEGQYESLKELGYM